MSTTEPATFSFTDFDDLYLREYPGLVGVAMALSGRDGEDLVQDTMVKALVNWERVSRLQRPGGWCHRILLNLCRSRWRKRRTEARYLGGLRREHATAPGPSPEIVDFWSAVRELPTRPRTIVAMYYAGDLPVAEIATALDIPAGTVRSDLARARQALRHSGALS